MAVRTPTAAGLVNAATAEFLLDPDGRFWFLEVNTRLQVEHGVTELVGRRRHRPGATRDRRRPAALADVLAAAERAATPERHAIEVRLSAEDPARDFAPAPGRIGRWEMPAGPGVRVDTGLGAGTASRPTTTRSSRSSWSSIRAGRLRLPACARALDETVVTGIQTTLPFHRFVARHPGFLAGRPVDRLGRGGVGRGRGSRSGDRADGRFVGGGCGRRRRDRTPACDSRGAEAREAGRLRMGPRRPSPRRWPVAAMNGRVRVAPTPPPRCRPTVRRSSRPTIPGRSTSSHSATGGSSSTAATAPIDGRA